MASSKRPKQPKITASVSVWERYLAKLREWDAARKRKEKIRKEASQIK
jgi:hypothetical protein